MTTRRRPPGRYDEPRALPRPVQLSLVGVLGVALLALVLIAYDRTADRRVPYVLQGYDVVDDRTVTVRFEVQKGEGTRVRCLVQALDRDKREVGTADLVLEPGDSKLVTTTITTTGRAATAQVITCRPAA